MRKYYEEIMKQLQAQGEQIATVTQQNAVMCEAIGRLNARVFGEEPAIAKTSRKTKSSGSPTKPAAKKVAKQQAAPKKSSAKQKAAPKRGGVDWDACTPKKGADGYYNWASYKAARNKYLAMVGKDYASIGRWMEKKEYDEAVKPFVKHFGAYVRKDNR